MKKYIKATNWEFVDSYGNTLLDYRSKDPSELYTYDELSTEAKKHAQQGFITDHGTMLDERLWNDTIKELCYKELYSIFSEADNSINVSIDINRHTYNNKIKLWGQFCYKELFDKVKICVPSEYGDKDSLEELLNADPHNRGIVCTDDYGYYSGSFDCDDFLSNLRYSMEEYGYQMQVNDNTLEAFAKTCKYYIEDLQDYINQYILIDSENIFIHWLPEYLKKKDFETDRIFDKDGNYYWSDDTLDV